MHSFIHAEPTKEGVYSGAKTATHPTWFKESFLDLDEDVSDATASNKRLVLYFWQPGCPYCNQLWEENFSDPKLVTFFRKNFEIIAINMWGDRDVISVAGKDYSEKSFAAALDIKYTPTLLFFNENKKVIHRLNGYVPPKAFKLSLDFAANKQEQKENFGRYASKRKASTANLKEKLTSTLKNKSNLHSEDFFRKERNFNKLSRQTDKYLAVFFEEDNCNNCDLLHTKTLQDKTTRKLVDQFSNVQLSRHANTPITTPAGVKSTAKDWADSLNIAYLPAIIFFNQEGTEVMRIDAQMRSFHIQSVFDYVLTEAYKTEPNFQRYISARADKIRATGTDVDIWKY
jgi:thioredoxin-related protein